jgi:transketolase
MKATQLLHDLGQSLWLDTITRDLLDNGRLQRYIDQLSVTGLTSNPTIFDQAIKHSTSDDAAIRQKLKEGKSGEAQFFELALMEVPVIHIFTHDSIGVGEDGPTHQPVEQLLSLYAIPGLVTLRPADANKVVEVWRVIMQFRHEPVALILTRQALPTLDRTTYASAEGVQRGAYILAEAPNGTPEVLLLATGSEVLLCLEAYEQLKAEGINARVVSMPSWEIFEYYCRQHPEYREHVLPAAVTARVSVEQASTLGWARYVGSTGAPLAWRPLGRRRPSRNCSTNSALPPSPSLQQPKSR